ncbi:MAG: hypothetical protein JRF33_16895 [Deltaproteobacteria bacterium]|nr:hypothetical protein [Deltaproteobacteria bacterium]
MSFVNMTNDAWFGKTAEPYLHLALAVFRTVEHRLAMVRSTNTGVSAFIDPMGRITQQTKLTDAEAIIETVPMMSGGTLYAWLGDWPAWLSILGMLWLWIRPLFLRRRSC